jgi:hypothetical protein
VYFVWCFVFYVIFYKIGILLTWLHLPGSGLKPEEHYCEDGSLERRIISCPVNKLLAFQKIRLCYVKTFIIFFETEYDTPLFILLNEDVLTHLAVRETINKLKPEFVYTHFVI